MSEPWASDFRALREHSRVDAPSLERTRHLVLASATTTEDPKEKTMSFIKRRPALAIAIALALIAVLTPIAYAVVDKVFLTIDPNKSEEEIERDVEGQLEKAGLTDPRVTAEKDADGRLEIGIRTEHPDGEVPELDVSVLGGGAVDAETQQNRVQIGVECELTPAETEALTDLVGSPAFYSILQERSGDQTDAELAAALRAVLAKHGFEAEVTVRGEDVSVKVTAPPR